VKSREKSLHSFQAEVKLRLLFFVRIAVDDVPILGQSVHQVYSDVVPWSNGYAMSLRNHMYPKKGPRDTV
jgi:hypothetical protein